MHYKLEIRLRIQGGLQYQRSVKDFDICCAIDQVGMFYTLNIHYKCFSCLGFAFGGISIAFPCFY